MLAAVAILSGLAMAAVGGELLVRATVAVATRLRVPARAIATTVVAFATSAPELAVSTSAAAAGRPAIGFGDSLGSNVTNIGLALGIGLLLARSGIERTTTLRDVVATFAAPLVTVLLVLDGRLGRPDALVLLGMFAVWLVRTVVVEVRMRVVDGDPPAGLRAPTVVAGLVGLALLIGAGRFVASGASDVASRLGIDSFVVGATLVAVGTSLPDIATALVAGRRGHHDVGFGTILGSNLFNGLLIVGVTALIRPVPVDRAETFVTLAFGVGLVAVLFIGSREHFARWRGPVLLAGYLAYVMTLAAVAGG